MNSLTCSRSAVTEDSPSDAPMQNASATDGGGNINGPSSPGLSPEFSPTTSSGGPAARGRCAPSSNSREYSGAGAGNRPLLLGRVEPLPRVLSIRLRRPNVERWLGGVSSIVASSTLGAGGGRKDWNWFPIVGLNSVDALAVSRQSVRPVLVSCVSQSASGAFGSDASPAFCASGSGSAMASPISGDSGVKCRVPALYASLLGTEYIGSLRGAFFSSFFLSGKSRGLAPVSLS